MAVATTQLTEAHRLAQVRIGEDTITRMFRIWPLLNPSDLDGTFPAWYAAVLEVVNGQRDLSAQLAAGYVSALRRLELPDADPVEAVLAAAVDPTQLATSMLVTGPASVRSALGRGVPFAKAVELGRSGSARSAMRHSLDGGRETIAESVAADPEGLGWARVASGKACAFCAMLASRGPVYSQDIVRFRSHDGCSCSAQPVYRRLGRDAWPPGSAEYRRLYDAAAKGTDDPANAFRRAYESQP